MSERPKRGEPIRKLVLKDGRTRYRVIIDAGGKEGGQRRQVSSTWDTLSEARDEIARIRVEKQSGTYVHKQNITLSAYIEQWLENQHQVKHKTRLGYANALKPAIEVLGARPIQDLGKSDVSGLVNLMLTSGGRKGEGRSPRTVELTLTLLRAVLSEAVKDKLLVNNVAASVKPPKSETPPIGQAWTPEQVHSFLNHVAGDRYEAAWRLSLYGLRRGEVLGLLWEDVDLGRNEVTVRQTRVVAGKEVVISTTKNGKVRKVPIGSEVATALRSFKSLQAVERLEVGDSYNQQGLVVVDERGIPMRPERYGDLFQAHARAAGLPRIRLHDLRHTAATLLKSKGVPMLTAASLLGHDPMIFAKVYGHDYEEDLRRAANTLSDVFTAGESAGDCETL